MYLGSGQRDQIGAVSRPSSNLHDWNSGELPGRQSTLDSPDDSLVQCRAGRQGYPRETWRNVSYREALDIVIADFPQSPIEDVEAWKADAVAVYNGVKHPNREAPDGVVRMNTVRKNIMVLRFWIGLKIGVPMHDLKERFEVIDQDKL